MSRDIITAEEARALFAKPAAAKAKAQPKPKPPKQPAAEAPRQTPAETEAQRRPARLRPAYGVREWPDGGGFRLVAHGLSAAQLACMEAAAAQCGIINATPQ